ncbi:MAG: hypothetical protein M0P31_13715 [Solirubrobacteraceae bacterium]|nr:hypothetical protein [Solirubrobacteraceae bacterium]
MVADSPFARENAPVLHQGVLLNSPALGEPAFVRLLGARAEHPWGPCMWMPYGELTPTVGDRCVVAQDSRGGTSIVVWQPAPS